MRKGMKFNAHGVVFFENLPCMLDRTFRPALGPSELLGFDCRKNRRQFCWGFDFRSVYKLPSFSLGTVTQIQILGERVILPVSCIQNATFPPNSCRPIEVDKGPLLVSPRLLNQEMGIQGKSLQLCEDGIVLIEVRPAALHHTHLGGGK